MASEFSSNHTWTKLTLHTVGVSQLNWPQTWSFTQFRANMKQVSLLALWLLFLLFLWPHSVSASLHLGGCLSSSLCVSLSFCLSAFFLLSVLLCDLSSSPTASFWNARNIRTLEQTTWAWNHLLSLGICLFICQTCLEGYPACNKHVIVNHYYYFPHLYSQLPQVVSGTSKHGDIADWREKTLGEKDFMGWGKQKLET